MAPSNWFLVLQSLQVDKEMDGYADTCGNIVWVTPKMEVDGRLPERNNA